MFPIVRNHAFFFECVRKSGVVWVKTQHLHVQGQWQNGAMCSTSDPWVCITGQVWAPCLQHGWKVWQDSLQALLFVDDIVIYSESEKQVEESQERWRSLLERRGLFSFRRQYTEWPNSPFCIDAPSGHSEDTSGDALLLRSNTHVREIKISSESKEA